MRPRFDYFSAADAEQFTFYRIPKALFTDKTFGKLSCEAKVLYGLMLDRVCLSIRNNWIDADGRAYIIFQSDEIAELMGCGRQKTFKLLSELDTDGGIGLIERCRRGQGKVSIIYVLNFNTAPDKPNGGGEEVKQAAQDGRENCSGNSIVSGQSRDENTMNTENTEPVTSDPGQKDNLSRNKKNQESVQTPTDRNNIYITKQEPEGIGDSCTGKLPSKDSRQTFRSGTLEFTEDDILGISSTDIKEGIRGSDIPEPCGGTVGGNDTSADFQKYEIHTSRSMNQDTGGESDFQKYEIHTSRNMKIIHQEVPKSYSNDTESSNTESSETESILSPLSSPRNPGGVPPAEIQQDGIGEDAMRWNIVRESVKEQICYDALCSEYGKDRVDEILEIMTEVIAGKGKSIMISGNRIPGEVVRARYRKINMFHIEYVFGCLDETETRIKNIRRYLIATLYNAPSTKTEYYNNRVRADGAIYGTSQKSAQYSGIAKCCGIP